MHTYMYTHTYMHTHTHTHTQYTGAASTVYHASCYIRAYVQTYIHAPTHTHDTQVLHPRCIMPAAMFGIPIEIRNTMDPSSEFTLITVDDFCKPVDKKDVANLGRSFSGSMNMRGGTPQTSPRMGMRIPACVCMCIRMYA